MKQITVNQRDFVITFDYDAKIVTAVKSLPNRKPKNNNGNWSWLVPIKHYNEVETFANKYDFVMTDEAKSAKPQIKETIVYDNVSISRLREFQKEGILYALNHKNCFIADEMGLGKTVQAIGVIATSNSYPALIMCPASLKLNWQREINKWLPGKTTSVINGKNNNFKADFVIINYDILKKHRNELNNFKAIIADESHYLKNYKAQRTELAKEIFKQAEYKILLTGTPVLNRPQELLSQLQIIDRLDDLGGFWHFAKHYCNAQRTRFGWDFSGAKNLEQLNAKLRDLCFIRRNKNEVLTELPEKQKTSIVIPISNRKEYNQAEKDLIAYLKNEVKQDKSFYASISKLSDEEKKEAISNRQNEVAFKARQAEHLVRINALKQLAAKGKIESVFEWVESFLETGESLVLFAHHTEIVKSIAERFNAPSITGSTTVENRQKAVDCFQAGNCQIIVGNIKAMGVGLTLTASSNVAFVELAWTPSDHDQAEDRVHRIGQGSNSVNVWYLLAENTIDEQIASLIDEKRNIVTAVTDGNEAETSTGIMSALTDWLVKR